jgi:putative peptidoglycan lipid II flippase
LRGYFRPWGHPFNPAVKASLILAPGLLILQATQHIYALTDRAFVSYLPEGSIGALSYAMTLVTLVPGLLSMGGSFITVLAENASREVRSLRLKQAISLAIFLALGSALFLFLFGSTVVQVLLERGMFGRTDTQLVHTALAAASGMMLPLFLLAPLDQVFQIEGRVGLMARRTLLGIAVNAALNAWFLFGLGWGLGGVALATTISYWVVLLFACRAASNFGMPLHWRSHIAWAAWLIVFLLLLWPLKLLAQQTEIGAWPLLAASTTATALLLLLGGLTYPGQERVLVRETLSRLLGKKP